MKREITIKPTVKELAVEFCELTAEKQVDFLVEVESIFRSWGSHERDTQMQAIGCELRAAQGHAAKLVRVLHEELTSEPPEVSLDRALRTATWPVAGQRQSGGDPK